MSILLAFLPFLGFALVDRFIGSTEALIVGALISAAMTGRDFLAGRSPKILEIGTLILFVVLALYVFLLSPAWSLWIIRLLVDLGLLVIVLVSMLIGKPFTLQYARESVDPALHNSREFLRVNYVITGVWAVAFAVMVLADLVLAFMPEVPQHIGIIITVIALVGAIKFTSWYPSRDRQTPG